MGFIEGENLYLQGRYEEAIKCFLESGCPKSLYYLGVCHLNGQGTDKDLDKARSYFNSSYTGLVEEATNGDAVSQLFLGNYFFYENIGGRCNFERAAEWYELSALNGNLTAKFNLANCLLEGDGIDADADRAAQLFAEVAAFNDMESIYNLAVYLEGSMAGGDISDALALYLMAAEMGSERAMFALGLSYVLGRSVEVDLNKGIKWLKKSAEKDFYPAITMLSSLNVVEKCDDIVFESESTAVAPPTPKKRGGLK